MKNQVGIIGLGKFGLKFGEILVSLGQEVLGVDRNPDKIKQAQNSLTHVYQLDAMNREGLEQIRIHDLEQVLVSVGDSIAASVMISMYLKEMGVKKVWGKAINKDHQKVLYKIGVDEVIIPEFMAAERVANRIAMPGFIEQLPFDKTMAVKELKVKEWAGKSLIELDLTNKLGIQVIAVRGRLEEEYHFIPKASEIFHEGDSIVAIGKITKMGDIIS